VGEHQEVARPEVWPDLGVVDGLLSGVGNEDHHHVGGLHGVGDIRDLETRLLGEPAALGAWRQPDDHIDPALVQVQRVRMPLAAIPDDRDRLPSQCRRIRVVVVVHPCGHWPSPLVLTPSTGYRVSLTEGGGDAPASHPPEVFIA
jgi:hypothetical protein